MRIEIEGRNVTVGDELRRQAERRFEKVARRVSPGARLELALREERDGRVPGAQVAEAALHLKGVTLRAGEASQAMARSINLVADEIGRQVERHLDRRRARRPKATVRPAAP